MTATGQSVVAFTSSLYCRRKVSYPYRRFESWQRPAGGWRHSVPPYCVGRKCRTSVV